MYTWRPLESYDRQGFIPTFISSAQTIKPPVPTDYDRANAEKLEKKLAGEYDETAGKTQQRTDAEAQFASAQTIKPPVPTDYDRANAEKLEKKLAGEYDETAGKTQQRTDAEAQFAE